MKQLTKINKTIIAIIAILIVIGTIVVLTKGFNVELKIQDNKKIELNLGKEFEVSEIKQITDEVFGKQQVIIQKVEVYEEIVAITAKEITDEQKGQIVNKVNEKYGTSLNAEDTTIATVPRLRLRQMVEQYASVFAIAIVIVLVYMSIRYYKIGSLKVILSTIGYIVITQLGLFSIIAITRIPVGRLTIPMIIGVLVLTLVLLTIKFEKILEKNKEEKNNNKK